MGTLLFVYIRAAGIVEFPYDLLILCFLVSLDSIAVMLALLARSVGLRLRLPESADGG